MYELIVIGFKQDMFRAATLLNKLIAANDDWVVDLRDGVAVYRDYSGRLRTDQSYSMTTTEGAAWGALWGSLIGALLAAPFTLGASAAAAGGGPSPLDCWAAAQLGRRAGRWMPGGGRTRSASPSNLWTT